MSTLLSPQERLRLSRAGLRELLLDKQAEKSAVAFPRSKTMRLLLGRGRSGVSAAAAGAALLWMLPGTRRILSGIPLSTVARLLFQSRH